MNSFCDTSDSNLQMSLSRIFSYSILEDSFPVLTSSAHRQADRQGVRRRRRRTGSGLGRMEGLSDGGVSAGQRRGRLARRAGSALRTA